MATQRPTLLHAVNVVALSCALCASSCGDAGPDKPHDDHKAITAANTTDPHWVKRHEPNTDVAVVFVHGLFGDTRGSWSTGSSGFFELIRADAELDSKVDIFAFGYTSKFFGAGSLDIDEAAKWLESSLDDAGVLEYPAVVLVTHSMGGLVAIQMLVSRPALRKRVPAVLLYASPQEGASIAQIARYVASNDALASLVPGDKNIFIRDLDDRWRQLASGDRPLVYCAYEKNETHGVKVVTWGSSTRFCTEPPQPISANHIDIVKPDRSGHPSYVMFRLALKPIVAKNYRSRLETPDFEEHDGKARITIDKPDSRREVRLRNTGAQTIEYSLDQWPDALWVWPAPGAHRLEPYAATKIGIAPAWGSLRADYKFVLTSNVSAARDVHIRISNLEALLAQRKRAAEQTIAALSSSTLSPQGVQSLRATSADESQARFVDAVRESIARESPELPEAIQWARTAELLEAANWHRLGTVALRRASDVDPSIARVPAFRGLAGRNAAFTGRPETGSIPAIAKARPEKSNLFTAPELRKRAEAVSRGMESVPALKTSGLILRGDLAEARGDGSEAVKQYREAVRVDATPANKLRLESLKQPSN